MRKYLWMVLITVFALMSAVPSRAEDGLQILTWPSGLVAGTINVEVSLGPSGAPAELFLDGKNVCTMTSATTRCSVDLGSALKVHLLELIRRGGSGGVREEVERWLNRPGREADLAIELAVRPIGDTCGGRLHWSGPTDGEPIDIDVEEAEQSWRIGDEGYTFGYPCPDSGRTAVLAATAIFADSRRAETAALVGSMGRAVGPQPQPVLLRPAADGGEQCSALASQPGSSIVRAERAPYEVVFVLDSTVDFTSLAGVEWSGDSDLEAPVDARGAWDRAAAAFSGAEHLWFVVPDSSLRRIDGFAGGQADWLGELFKLGSATAEEPPRLADAVATAGLVAAAAPHRRAVVLILGSGGADDPSHFSVDEVRAYLSEIGVPLQVVRTSGSTDDSWPEGVAADDLTALAEAFESARRRLDRQCVAWLPHEMRPDEIPPVVPAGMALAGQGRSETAPTTPVWRRAEVRESSPGQDVASEAPFEGERVEVTAVDVLVRATDQQGQPVTDLKAGDLAVTEDGTTVPLLGVESVRAGIQEELPKGEEAVPTPTAAPPSRIIVPVAIYVERQLAGPSDLAPALQAVADRAEWLTGLGPVEVVVADRTVKTVLTGATDAAVVRKVLEDQADRGSRDHGIERIRTEYLRENRKYPDRGSLLQVPEDSNSSAPSNVIRFKTMSSARKAIAEEDDLLQRTMERLNDWALSQPGSGPRMLVTIGLGFDEDPSDFYIPFIEQKDPSLSAEARSEFLDYHQATRVGNAGRELAAAGWLVVPLATRTVGSARTGAEFGGGDRFQAFLTDRQDAGYIRDVDFMMVDPLGSQEHLARPSGGKVVLGGKGLDKLIEESSGWYRLTYQVARAPDGAYHDVAITSNRQGVDVRGTGVVVSGTSEGRAAMRSRRLFVDSESRGELPVTLSVGPSQSGEGKARTADLSAIVDLSPIATLFKAGGARALRFSVVVRSGDAESEVVHQLVTVKGSLSTFRYDVPLQWTKNVPSKAAVVVEDLGSGAWGGNVVEFGR